MRLTLASKNQHKLVELQKLLGAFADLSSLPNDIPLPEETGKTFEANALLKARYACQKTNKCVLADDSGLSVQALNNAPGIYSARFAGLNSSDADNRALLIHMLREKNLLESQAFFTCALALVKPNGEEFTFTGECHGKVITLEKGEHGFGYDSLFIPDGYSQSFGQMPSHEKGEISHRKKALNQLIQFLKEHA